MTSPSVGNVTSISKPPLVNGKPIKYRTLQQVAWSIGLGVVVFGFFASGLYFAGTQVHWCVHFGSFYHCARWVKPSWDDGMGIIHRHTPVVNTANWTAQFGIRHAVRNIGLPALATMGALSVAGGAKKPGSRLYTAIAPILVLVTALVLIVGGMWLALWANAHWLSSLTAQQMNWLHLTESVALGFLIGKVLHLIWRPAGTRIQRFLVERNVDHWWRTGGHVDNKPVWVTEPLAPPTAREAADQLIEEDWQSGEGQRLHYEGRTARSSAIYWLVGAGVVVILGVDFVGFIGHIWAGVLHQSFPYLAP